MLSLRYVSKTSARYLASHLTAAPPPHFSTATALTATPRSFADSMKAWFNSSYNSKYDSIFDIFSREDEKEKQTQLMFSHLGSRITEKLVLEVLKYGNSKKKDVLSCLKFFDWAGHQAGFFHTPATHHAIFKILSKAKLMSLALDFLDSHMSYRFYSKRIRFYETLVIGYAVSGLPSFAMNLLNQMRYNGHDLDSFGYHVLLNALVEVGLFDAAQIIVADIRNKGFESYVTHSILVKCFCRQGLLDDAEAFLRRVIAENGVGRSHGYALSTLVEALFKDEMFEKAGGLIEEFMGLGVDVNSVYGVWLRYLVQAGLVDNALKFLKSKRISKGYVPDVFHYNTLLCGLLREKKYLEAWDVLVDMKVNQIRPNEVTMNVALCLFCKAGMMDLVLEIINSSPEFDLTSNKAYNLLISTLCGFMHVDEAMMAFELFSKQGYFPDRRTFRILARTLFQKGKTDIVMQLIDAAQGRNVFLSFPFYMKLVKALCLAGSLQRNADLIQQDCRRFSREDRTSLYLEMIYALLESDPGDKAFDLLVEMQENGLLATHASARAVIRRLCSNGNVEVPLLKLLSQDNNGTKGPTWPKKLIFNMFISGAGLVKDPKLARKMFEMMMASDKPNHDSYSLMLQSYLRNEKVSDAVNFFNALPEELKDKRMYGTMIIGLCKIHKTEQARACLELTLAYFIEARRKNIVPSRNCYEEVLKLLCTMKEYDRVVYLLDDFETVGCHVTSFIGNALLLESLKNDYLYQKWIQSRIGQDESSSEISKLMQLLGEFSGRVTLNQDIENFEEALEKCFQLEVYTYNLLMTKFSENIDDACWLFQRLRNRGLEPNQRTYEILANALFRHGRTAEAKMCVQEMLNRGFQPKDVALYDSEYRTPR